MRRGEAVTGHRPDQPDLHRRFAGSRERDARASALTALGARIVAIAAAAALERAMAPHCAALGCDLCGEDFVGGGAFDWHGKPQTIAPDAAHPYRIWRVRPEWER